MSDDDMKEYVLINTDDFHVSLFPDPARNYREALLYVEVRGKMAFSTYIDMTQIEKVVEETKR